MPGMLSQLCKISKKIISILTIKNKQTNKHQHLLYNNIYHSKLLCIGKHDQCLDLIVKTSILVIGLLCRLLISYIHEYIKLSLIQNALKVFMEHS